MGGVGFVILIIVIVSIYRSMTKAAKEANEKAVKKLIAKSKEAIEEKPQTTTPKPPVQQSKYIATKAAINWEKQEDTQPEIKLDSMEEIRRAIIYSEIMNRKY